MARQICMVTTIQDRLDIIILCTWTGRLCDHLYHAFEVDILTTDGTGVLVLWFSLMNNFDELELNFELHFEHWHQHSFFHCLCYIFVCTLSIVHCPLIGNRTVMPNSHRPSDTTRQSCLCRVSGVPVWIGRSLWTCPDFFCRRQSWVVGNPIHTLTKRTRHRQDSFVASGVAVQISCKARELHLWLSIVKTHPTIGWYYWHARHTGRRGFSLLTHFYRLTYVCLSVCPSVCPLVCPSHTGIASKRLNGMSWFSLERMLPSTHPMRLL